jgi:hypothetical protein
MNIARIKSECGPLALEQMKVGSDLCDRWINAEIRALSIPKAGVADGALKGHDGGEI